MTNDTQQSPTVTVWGRLTKEERETLERIALTEDRTLSYVVTRVLRDFLTKHLAAAREKRDAA